MTFKVGDRVTIKNCGYLGGSLNGQSGYISDIDFENRGHPYKVIFPTPIYSKSYCFYESELEKIVTWADIVDTASSQIENTVAEFLETKTKTHGYYDFPGGVEVRQISAHLTGFGAQALQYVARATRLDGKNKGDVISDLTKAIDFIRWEIERLQGESK